MGFKCGIIGLPNVGKSTLFNALTETTTAESANYPFCTIEPNIGNVIVPDDRLNELASITKSKNIIPTQMQFLDIAGLVKGASKGEGLGNKFLSHIREVDAIIHVLRCFKNENITHVNEKIDPIFDNEIVETELILADINSLEKQMDNLKKKIRSHDKDLTKAYELMQKLSDWLSSGKMIRKINNLKSEEILMLKSFHLLTSKPQLYVCNVDEKDINKGNELTEKVTNNYLADDTKVIMISSLIESEICALKEEEKKEFLKDLGVKQTGLSKLIKAGYELLNLLTFFTVGPKESRAWTIKNGSTAPIAAGKIHTDIKKGFIRVETISYIDFIENKGEQGAKDSGKLRIEGSEYIVQDGDILNFRFNV